MSKLNNTIVFLTIVSFVNCKSVKNNIDIKQTTTNYAVIMRTAKDNTNIYRNQNNNHQPGDSPRIANPQKGEGK